MPHSLLPHSNADSTFATFTFVLISPIHSKTGRIEKDPDLSHFTLFWDLEEVNICGGHGPSCDVSSTLSPPSPSI